MFYKQFAYRFTAVALALTTLAACSKGKQDDPMPTPMPTTVSGMSWMADGSSVTANSIQPTFTATDVSINGFAGNTASSTSVYLLMPAAVGTYQIAPNSTVRATYTTSTNAGGDVRYYATGGTLAITALTATSITGTFSFTGQDSNGSAPGTKAVSNGKFTVPR